MYHDRGGSYKGRLTAFAPLANTAVMAKTLGSEIRRLRLEADITLRGFARQLGHTAAHQSDIEHGRRMPSDEVLQKTVAALAHVGADYDELKELDTRLGRDLEQWIQNHPDARAMLREMKASGRSAKQFLKEWRERLESKDEEADS